MLKISFKFIGLLFILIILSIWLNYLNPIEKIKIKNALYNDVEILNFDGYSFRDLNKNNSIIKIPKRTIDNVFIWESNRL